jgi:hypothetical protein
LKFRADKLAQHPIAVDQTDALSRLTFGRADCLHIAQCFDLREHVGWRFKAVSDRLVHHAIIKRSESSTGPVERFPLRVIEALAVRSHHRIKHVASHAVGTSVLAI